MSGSTSERVPRFKPTHNAAAPAIATIDIRSRTICRRHPTLASRSDEIADFPARTTGGAGVATRMAARFAFRPHGQHSRRICPFTRGAYLTRMMDARLPAAVCLHTKSIGSTS
jgi:hypothetical protein